MMNQVQTTKSPRLWRRATTALGKLWQGMVSLPDRPTQRELEQDYPRFPFF
jgi:hypothetical protein